MSKLAQINDEVLTSDDFVKFLKFTESFEDQMEKLLKDRLTVHAARKQGLEVPDEKIQERVDQIRRVQGLHRAKDTMEYLDRMGVSVEEFGNRIRDDLLKEEMVTEICNEQAIEAYFKLNSPQFDAVELRHIMVDSANKAKELIALLEEEPEEFEDMAREHSLSADTAKSGGDLGRCIRGTLDDEIEAKVFNASEGDILGPFGNESGLLFEIFRIDARVPAQLNDTTTESIHNIIYTEWLKAQAVEHRIDLT